MDRVAAARAALDGIMRRVGAHLGNGPARGVETVVLTDGEHDQYGLFRFGWQPGTGKRVSNTLFLARIKDGKVWIEEDNTDLTLADELLRAGIPREDIVLAFHPPEMRHLTEFAVA